jgi:hypothetical protein
LGTAILAMLGGEDSHALTTPLPVELIVRESSA